MYVCPRFTFSRPNLHLYPSALSSTTDTASLSRVSGVAMPDLGNLLDPTSSELSHSPNLKPPPPHPATDPCPPSLQDGSAIQTLAGAELLCRSRGQRLRFTFVRRGQIRKAEDPQVLGEQPGASDPCKKKSKAESLQDRTKEPAQLPCFLPFLSAAPRLVDCLVCNRLVYPGEEVLCSVRGCQGVYHLTCAKKRLGFSITKSFKCPQHACFICKQRLHWRCVRCTIASHDKCAAWPDKVISLNQPGRAVCWRHPTDWRLEKKHAAPVSKLEDVFSHLPVPYVEEEFKIDFTLKGLMDNNLEPTPYVHIRRNVYLVKKKRDDAVDDVGCTNCSSICSENCVCRVQCISCSKACRCSEVCTNRPFRKEKKIKIVKTELCGWGVVAAELISKGDFIIEYIGEVIDDALCEKRLWDMKHKGVQNFYMCEIRKDFTIDATFKGNLSRFLNHSCDPNCKLEKWQVDGETRVGVFAARSIKVGEPLTYDYRFVQFGPQVVCQCGAQNCQGYLGTKRKIGKVISFSWGVKRRRTSTACLKIVSV